MRRAQAAMEFLMSYGWALLIVLVAIGALSYFGIFNAKDTQPERCLLSTGFSCGGYQLKVSGTDAQFLLYLRNSNGKDIDLEQITVTPDFSYTSNSCEPLNLGGVGLTNGKEYVITCDFVMTGQIADAEKVKLDVNLAYKDDGGSYNRKAEGDVVVNTLAVASI